MDLILASTSTYRHDLLARLRISFRCESSGVEERAYDSLGLEPIHLAETLARAKAVAVAAKGESSTVIGADQLVAFEGRVLGKPGTEARAVEQLLAMAGRDHQLITAVAIADGAGVEAITDVATMRIRPLTRAEAERYVAIDRPMDCAGSYKIESLGIALFDRIDAADHTAIVGLPLIALGRMLRARGFAIP